MSQERYRSTHEPALSFYVEEPDGAIADQARRDQRLADGWSDDGSEVGPLAPGVAGDDRSAPSPEAETAEAPGGDTNSWMGDPDRDWWGGDAGSGHPPSVLGG